MDTRWSHKLLQNHHLSIQVYKLKLGGGGGGGWGVHPVTLQSFIFPLKLFFPAKHPQYQSDPSSPSLIRPVACMSLLQIDLSMQQPPLSLQHNLGPCSYPDKHVLPSLGTALAAALTLEPLCSSCMHPSLSSLSPSLPTPCVDLLPLV